MFSLIGINDCNIVNITYCDIYNTLDVEDPWNGGSFAINYIHTLNLSNSTFTGVSQYYGALNVANLEAMYVYDC